MNLKGKTALITGGSRGIGLAIARKYAEHGASICLVARNSALLDQVVQTLPTPADQKHTVITHDVSTTPPSSKVLPPVVDILVNSAGITQSSLLLATTPGVIQDVINTNLFGTISMTQALLRSMLKRRDCSVINISSVLSSKHIKGTAVYSASKAGVEAFTRAMANEMQSRVRFNCLQLGLVDTDMGKSVTPEVRSQLLSNNSVVSLEQVAEAAFELIPQNGQILPLGFNRDQGEI